MRINSLVPELSVTRIETSLRFYVETLGFKVDYNRPADKFAFLSLGNAQLMLEEVNGHWDTAPLERPFGRGINFQIEVGDLDAILARLGEAAHPLFLAPRTDRYEVAGSTRQQRQFIVLYPDGYSLRFCQELSP